jgi:predicted dehydrogenase
MEKIKFALIGCGRIAQRHAQHIANFGELTATCDIVTDKAKTLANEYNCNYYPDIDELLNSGIPFDVVSVCTPNGMHAEHSIKSLQAGKHVLCEKPMAITAEDCREMIRTAGEADKKLFIVKQNRFNPPIAELKKAIDLGKLGKILSVQVNCFWNRRDEYYLESPWKGQKKLDGGTLFTQFSHFIDLMYWLVGDVKNMYAMTNNLNHVNIIEFEDTGVIAVEFENGALGNVNYTVNSYGKNMEGSITLFGSRGTVKVGGQYLNTLEYQQFEDYEIVAVEEARPANDYGFYQGSMSNHDKVYENVINVLQNKGDVATSGEEGLKTVEIIERIYQLVQ